MAALNPDNIRALEQTRQRLLGLHTSLAALHQDLYAEHPLPSWPSLQSHSALISSNLQALAQQLSEQQQLLYSLTVHPLPQFPSHQAHIIEQMLRTKLEPDVEDWVEQGAKKISQESVGALSDHDRNELWQWAPSAANAEARRQKWGADYTLSEKEAGVDQVITGLNRELVVPPDETEEEGEEYEEVTDEEEDEEADKMDVETRSKPNISSQAASSRPATSLMPLNSIHKFMVTGKTG